MSKTQLQIRRLRVVVVYAECLRVVKHLTIVVLLTIALKCNLHSKY